MPEYIKGRQLKSYGGMLTYTILYRGQGRQTSRAPHVVLSVSIKTILSGCCETYSIILLKVNMDLTQQ